jgi:hypothetical protein
VKRWAGVLAAAVWSAVALVGPVPSAGAAVDTKVATIPVNAAQTLEMSATANCVTVEARCFVNTQANLRAPEGVVGFPGDLWARQTTTLRTMDRTVYTHFTFNVPNTRSFKSLTDVEFTTIYFGGGPPEKFQFRAEVFPVDWRTGGPRTDVPLIVCSHIQVVWAGVNLTSPDACAQAAFS